MEDNLYLIEIIYFIFYVLVIVFIYFNSTALYNFSQSNKIIIENDSSRCETDIKGLPFVTENTLIPCVQEENKNDFYYFIEDSNLSFVVTKDSSKSGNFITICKNYCHNYDPVSNKCTSENKTTYENCINLLQPPKSCSNSSMPVAVDKTSSSILYVKKNPIGNTC